MESFVERHELEARAGALDDPTVRVRVIESLTFPSTLADWGARDGRLLCLSTHGRTAMGKAVLGSVAAGVVHAAMAPFVMVGPHADVDATEPFDSLVVCVDGTEPLDLVADAVAGLDRAFDARTTVVTVDRPGPIVMLRGPKAFEPLDRLGTALLERGRHPDRKLLEDDDVAAAVARFTGRQVKPLLVVGSRQSSVVTRLARPNTALAIVRHAPTPVLVVPYGRAAQRRRRARSRDGASTSY
jgi:nucleotide-binding universal stress UspA family protein